jgi:hypothetical protein
MRTSRTLLALALGVAAVAGCKKKENSTVGADSSLVANEPAFRVQNIDLGKSVGTDKRVVASTDNFGTRDTVYASVMTEGSAPSKTITARWTFEDGQVVNEETQTISPSGPAVTEFHITKATPWPAGKYKVEILVDGASAGTKDFEVK